jgi:regulator of protease activity HflC (stomatin/prohibitin superfamily)
MFDKIIDLFVQFWSYIKPITVVPPYSKALLIRLGKIHKTLDPGLHFKIPLIDRVLEYYTVITTINLPAQSIFLSKTKTNIVVKGMIKYRIVDGKEFFLKAYGAKEAIGDVTQGIIKTVLIEAPEDMVYTSEIDNEITDLVAAEAREWGIEVEAVVLTDIAPIRSLRLLHDTRHETSNNDP